MTGVNILAIDGGAMMGVIPARILSYIEGNASSGTYTSGSNTIDIPTPYTLSGGHTVPNIGKQSADSFSCIAGTSTGGLLASALGVQPLDSSYSAPLTANQALAFYCDNSSEIFPAGTSETGMLTEGRPAFGNNAVANAIAELYGAPSWAMSLVRNPPAHSYDPATFTPTAITNPFAGKDTSFASLATGSGPTILITSFNNNLSPPASGANPLSFQVPVASSIDQSTTPQGPIFVSNGTTVTNGSVTGQPLSVLQACLMTSAFPMLLPPVPYDLQFGDDNADQGAINYFLDGGIYAGNPALATYLYCVENGIEINSFISVGCGAGGMPTGLDYSTVDLWGGYNVLYTGWLNNGGATPLLGLMQHAPGIATNALLGQLMPGKFFRLDPTLTDTSNPAWSSAPSAIEGWVAAADTLVKTMNTLTVEGQSDLTLWQNMINTIAG